jgi:SAM-dependent methyltransferase
MLHFPHPERALAAAFRVLQPGGKIAFSVWATPDKAVGFAMVLKAIEAHGTTDVPLPPGPPFFRFSDWEESRRALLEAGFVQPDVRDVDQTLVLCAPETPFHALMRGGVRVAAMLNAPRRHLRSNGRSPTTPRRIGTRCRGATDSHALRLGFRTKA